MHSVADDLRADTRRDVMTLSPAARMQLALKLGDDDTARLCVARAIEPEQARGLIAATRQLGRVPSRCHRFDAA